MSDRIRFKRRDASYSYIMTKEVCYPYVDPDVWTPIYGPLEHNVQDDVQVEYMLDTDEKPGGNNSLYHRKVFENQPMFDGPAYSSIIYNKPYRWYRWKYEMIKIPSYSDGLEAPSCSEDHSGVLLNEVMRDLSGAMEAGMLSIATVGEIGSLKNITKSGLDVAQNLKGVFTSKGTIGKVRSLAQADLAYRFGIKTLVQDCGAALSGMTALNNRLKSLLHRNRQHSFSISKALNSGLDGDVWDGTCQHRVTATCSSQYRIDDAFASKLLADYYGVSKLLSTAWELTPFSFVVDYFVSIGDLIEEIEHRIIYDTRDEYTSLQRACYSKKCYGSAVTDAPVPYCETNMPKMVCKQSSYTRVPLALNGSSILDALQINEITGNQMKTMGELILTMSG